MKRPAPLLLASCLIPLLITGCAASTARAPLRYSPPDPANWGHDFYWASEEARGAGLCPSELSRELENRFDSRFGRRFRDLKAQYQEQFGTSPDFVIVSVCRRSNGDIGAERANQRRAMTRFKTWLDIADDALEAHISTAGAP